MVHAFLKQLKIAANSKAPKALRLQLESASSLLPKIDKQQHGFSRIDRPTDRPSDRSPRRLVDFNLGLGFLPPNEPTYVVDSTGCCLGWNKGAAMLLLLGTSFLLWRLVCVIGELGLKFWWREQKCLKELGALCLLSCHGNAIGLALILQGWGSLQARLALSRSVREARVQILVAARDILQ